MSLCPYDGKGEGKLEFSWGRKRVIGSTEGCTYYESFMYTGVEYFLYDSVYLCCADELEPYVGKVVNMWETASHERIVKIVWFLRPGEVRWHLGGLKPQSNEIFLASGEGLGLCNDNNLVTFTLMDAVERFFNQRRNQKVVQHPKPVGSLSKKHGIASSSKLETDTTVGRVKEEQYRRSFESNDLPMKKRKLEGYSNVKPDKAPQSIVKNSKCIPEPQVEELIRRPSLVKEERSQRSNESDNHRIKKAKLEGISGDSNVKPDKALHLIVEKPMDITEPQAEELTKRPSAPWEERLRKAHVDGSLVLLENLDPSYSSSEVEDVVRQAFNKKDNSCYIQIKK